MPGHDIIVIGASAGGVEALRTLVGTLPAGLPAAIFVVVHIPPQGPSLLPGILARAGALPAVHPADGDPITAGTIYVAPPDRHLLVDRGTVRLARGPKENRARPAVDPLFRTAARTYGPRVVGVVLTGALDDGTAGLQAIKQRGGVALVQDPHEALYAGMPRSALENVAVDGVLPLAALGEMLTRLTQEPAADEAAYPVPPDMETEAKVAEMETGALRFEEIPGTPSAFACPECHGTLWELRDDDLIRFRCRVGHAYSPESLLAEHGKSLEAALWAALRALEEAAALSRRMAAQARQRQHFALLRRYEIRAVEQEENAAVLRQVLRTNGQNVEIA